MIHCLLVGPPQQGGEGVYVREIFDNAPAGIVYSVSQNYHQGAGSTRCNAIQEILLNRLVHRFLNYTFGFRVLTPGNDVDLVHIHSVPAKLHLKRRIPIVMSAGSSHYIYVRDYERWSEAKIRTVYRRAHSIYRRLGIYDELLHADQVARIYTLSDWARQIYLRHGVPGDKVDVIPPGFEVPPLPQKKPHDTVNFLFIGREFVRKGGPLVVEVFERLRQQNKQISLTIVTRDIEHVRTVDGAKVLPFMPRKELYDTIYPAADVFVMPTEAEGWGFTNAEAMSFALPVISTNINAIPEIVEHEQTGVLIKPCDGDALFSAMKRLAENSSLREEMGHRGRVRYIARFSRDVFRNRLQEFYKAAMGK